MKDLLIVLKILIIVCLFLFFLAWLYVQISSVTFNMLSKPMQQERTK